jgi:hypothetical protein
MMPLRAQIHDNRPNVPALANPPRRLPGSRNPLSCVASRLHGFRNGAVSCLMLTALAACSTVGQPSAGTPFSGQPRMESAGMANAVRADQRTPLGADWSDFLATSPEGSATHLSTPEGLPVVATAGERYASASGRDCRRFRIGGDGGRGGAGQPRIACMASEGWQATRPVVATTIGE